MSSLFFVILLAAGTRATIPHGWEACSKSSNGYNDCMIKQINSAIQELKSGSKQLGVSSLDPLKILALSIDQGAGPVSIKLSFKDIQISGLSSCVLKSFKNTDWKKLEGKVLCKVLEVNGPYKIEGKVLTLPIQGEGNSNIHADDAVVDVVIKIREIKNEKRKHFHVDEFYVDITPTKISYNLENLFNGNKALGENMNTFINENGEQIFKELKPAISEALSQAFSQISNQIFSKISSDEINIK